MTPWRDPNKGGGLNDADGTNPCRCERHPHVISQSTQRSGTKGVLSNGVERFQAFVAYCSNSMRDLDVSRQEMPRLPKPTLSCLQRREERTNSKGQHNGSGRFMQLTLPSLSLAPFRAASSVRMEVAVLCLLIASQSRFLHM